MAGPLKVSGRADKTVFGGTRTPQQRKNTGIAKGKSTKSANKAHGKRSVKGGKGAGKGSGGKES